MFCRIYRYCIKKASFNGAFLVLLFYGKKLIIEHLLIQSNCSAFSPVHQAPSSLGKGLVQVLVRIR